MNNQITKEDVVYVAQSIGKILSEEQINEVLEMYPSEQEKEPFENCMLVLENIIYTLTL